MRHNCEMAIEAYVKPSLSWLPSASILAFLVAGLPYAGPAFAQTTSTAQRTTVPVETQRETEVVIVTGSNIRRNGYNESAPVQVFGESAPEFSVATTINDFVGNLPANTGSQLSNVGTKNPNLIGAANFNLRNLGAGSTLVLINGCRAGKARWQILWAISFLTSTLCPLLS